MNVCKDKHGLYVRQGGYVWRPEHSEASWSQRADLPSGTKYVYGMPVFGRHTGGATITLRNLHGNTEVWFSHGAYLSNGEQTRSEYVYSPRQDAKLTAELTKQREKALIEKFKGLLVKRHHNLRCEFNVTTRSEAVYVSPIVGKTIQGAWITVRRERGLETRQWGVPEINWCALGPQDRGIAFQFKRAIELAIDIAIAMEAGAVRAKFYKGDEA